MQFFEEWKQKSKWHFDWFKEEPDPYFSRTICTLKGDWNPNIQVKERLTNDAYRTDGHKKVYKNANIDYENLYIEGMYDKDFNKDYQKIIDAIGIGNPRTLIHIQIPGQMHPIHMDLAYGGGKWDYLGDNKEDKLVRVFIMLADWCPGQVILMGNEHIVKWKKGDVIYFRWQDVPHGTCNFGHDERPMMFITGELTDKFQQLLDSKEKQIINI
jgi:hypothetical protein